MLKYNLNNFCLDGADVLTRSESKNKKCCVPNACTTILLFCLFSSIGVAMGQNNFIIQGTAESKFEGVEVHLSFSDNDIENRMVLVRDGRFQIAGTIGEQYAHANISIIEDGESLLRDDFFLEPGKIQIHIKDSINKAKAIYVNVPFLVEKRKYDSTIMPLEDSVLYYSSAARKLEKNYSKGVIDSIIGQFIDMKSSRKLEFVAGHPGSFMALYVFYDLISSDPFGKLPLNRLDTIYAKFTMDLKKTKLGQDAGACVELKQSFLIDRFVKNIQFTSSEGVRYDLSSFRGKKSVLLCFWASWCKGCISSLPCLKDISRVYGPKGIQMISISVDNDAEKWLQAIKRYDIPWIQTCDLPPFTSGNQLSNQFDIKSVPHYLLIDSEGRIIYNYQQVRDDGELSILNNTLKRLYN